MTSGHPPGRLLATVDVEIASDRELSAQIDALWRLEEDLRHCPVTWFCTADAAELFANPLRALVRGGHDLGCHGLDHGAWEDYRTMPAERAAQSLHEATVRIESAIGVRPTCFRGPRMTTSVAAQQALRSLGYRADFSVCARRLDFPAASCFSWRWIRVGASPYRPSLSDPFRTADQPDGNDIVVVPLSGFGLPLCSGTLYVLGETAALALAIAARRAQNAPLVYLFHSYEFAPLGSAVDRRPWHQRLYPRQAEKCYQLNRRFLDSLRHRMQLAPVTAREFLREATYAQPAPA